MTTDELIDTLKVHRFEPGDRLILKVPGRLNHPDDYEAIRETMERWAPGVPCVVITEGMELEVARGLAPPLSPQEIAELRQKWESYISGASMGAA